MWANGGMRLEMIKWVKWFITHMFDPNGRISAPQVTGFLMCMFACLLSAIHDNLETIVPVLSTGMGLLGVSGTIEVLGASANRGIEK